MVQMQDSTDPTGVAGPVQRHGDPGNDTVVRARERKANAAIQMRLAGATWDEIAQTLGFPTARQALVATEKALERQLQSSEDREQMRRLAGARLERLLRAIWPKAIDPNHPDQMLAVTKSREIVDRHAKLFGLDAPTEVVVHTPTQTELEQWVSRVVSVASPPVEEFDIIAGEVLELEAAEATDWTIGEFDEAEKDPADAVPSRP